MKGKEWTKEETEILRSMWAAAGTIKSNAHLLPNRTLYAIMGRIAELGLPSRGSRSRSSYRWVEESITRALNENGPLNCHQLSALTGASWPRIRQTMRGGHGTKFRIDGWCRLNRTGNHTPVWAIGTGEDAPKPPVQTRQEKNRRERVRNQRSSANPFAPALGLIQTPAAGTGRVIHHLWDEPEEIAA